MKYYCEEKDLVMRQLDSGENGLSQAEAERRLAENGKNKLAEPKKDSLIKRFLSINRSLRRISPRLFLVCVRPVHKCCQPARAPDKA